MSKATKPDADQQSLQNVEKTQDDLTLSNAKATAGDIIADFSTIPDAMLQGLTMEYLQLKQNTTYNMVFIAMTTFSGDQRGEVPAVELVNEEGAKFINANTVLVNSLKKVTQMPCLVRIVTGETVKSSKGTYLDMEVFVLHKTVQKQ